MTYLKYVPNRAGFVRADDFQWIQTLKSSDASGLEQRASLTAEHVGSCLLQQSDVAFVSSPQIRNSNFDIKIDFLNKWIYIKKQALKKN